MSLLKSSYKAEKSVKKAVRYPVWGSLLTLGVEIVTKLLSTIGVTLEFPILDTILGNAELIGMLTTFGALVFIVDLLKHGLGWKLPVIDE